MKKNWTMKVAALMLALTMITACFVGSTFAKYVSKAQGEATARVAQWGIVMEIEGGDEVFKTEYDLDDTSYTTVGSSSVISNNGDKVVAPGTKSDDITVTISGTPEVAFVLALTLNQSDDIVLPAGTYTDYSTTLLDGTHPEFTVDEDYHPIHYTIAIDIPGIGQKSKTGTLEEIIAALNRFGNQHDGNDDLVAAFPANTSCEGTITLSWEWPFEQDMDQADTYLGNIAAGVCTAEGAVTTLNFNVIATATQID